MRKAIVWGVVLLMVTMLLPLGMTEFRGRISAFSAEAGEHRPQDSPTAGPGAPP